MNWRLEGNEEQGKIIGNGEEYDYWMEDGYAHVRLPFDVDERLLRELLVRSGYVAGIHDEGNDSFAWGEELDVEGYYPYWLYPERSQSSTVFAFPPKDYRTKDVPEIVAGNDNQGEGHVPIFSNETMSEFARWIDIIQRAKKQTRP